MKAPAVKAKAPRIRHDEFVHPLVPLHKAVLKGYFLRSHGSDDINKARTRAEWQKLLDAQLTRPID